MKLGGLLEMMKQYRINFLKNKKKKKLIKVLYIIGITLSYPFVLLFRQSKPEDKPLKINNDIAKIEILVSKNEVKKASDKLSVVEEKIEKITDENVKQECIKKVDRIKTMIDSNISVIAERPCVNTNKLKEKPCGPIIENRINIDKSIKESVEEITTIKQKINKNNYNDLYDNERKIKELELKIQKLKEECKKNNIIYDVKTSELTISDLELKLNELTQKIENKKDEIFNYRKRENIEEKTTNEKNKDKMQKINYEQKLINEIITKNIKENKKLINKFRYAKRVGLLDYLKKVTHGIINVILPFAFFRNPLLNTLVSSVMLNNSVKSMRKLMENDYHVNYEIISNEIYSKEKMLIEVERLNTSSLNEIYLIRENIINIYQNNLEDAVRLLSEIDYIENKLKAMNKRIASNQAMMKKEKTKIIKCFN